LIACGVGFVAGGPALTVPAHNDPSSQDKNRGRNQDEKRDAEDAVVTASTGAKS
jgi:hypothetical protein